MNLNGIINFSMGNFLCLRGFASFKELSRVSDPNPDYQRALIEEHRGEMASFLNNGDYRFFPEVILSLSFSTGNNIEAIDRFYEAIRIDQKWNQRLGEYNISIYTHQTRDKVKIAQLSFNEETVRLKRIDGNHRLSAANDVVNDFMTPFCLLLFRTHEEDEQFSRAIFHNINAKQIPLKLEDNFKVILESPQVFSDEKLKKDPSFGWAYYLARKIAQSITLSDYPFIQSLIRNYEYTFLIEECQLLIKKGKLSENESAVGKFIEQFPAIEAAMQDAKLQCIPQNLAVFGTIAYYKLTDTQKYSCFICWAKKNCIVQATDIHISDLISVFDKVYENMSKSVFMSMQFSTETQDTYQTVKDVKAILKRENSIELNIIKVDEHQDGYSDEIYHRIIAGIQKASLVIADLSYGNRNVYHEIGYAQGLGKKVLLLYQLRDGIDPKEEIGSNISMHDQVRFHNQTELRPALLKKIRQFFNI